MTKGKIKHVTVSAWHGVISRINLNTICIALITAYFGYKQFLFTNEHEADDKKQEQTTKVDSSWRKKSEIRWAKVDSSFHVMDSLIRTRK